MADMERHNAFALQKEYEEYQKERELAPVGYQKFGGEQDETVYEFVRTSDGRYIEKSTTKLPSGKEYTTYKGEVSFEGNGGVEERHFVSDIKMSPDTKLASYSGFSLNLETGKSESYLTTQKPELFGHIEEFFNVAQAQAVIDAQNLTTATVQDN